MGIESDQVVYEYLSRVGDVAHQRQLPSATRMRLVSELRNEIDRCRARVPVDSPAAVRRILDRLGTPSEVVEAAGGRPPVPQPPDTSVPGQREPESAADRPKGLRRVVPRPRPTGPQVPAPRDAPSPPHLASAQELGDSVTQPEWTGVPPAERIRDWWRVEGPAFGGTLDDSVPGFVGGVEIPDLLKRPRKDGEDGEDGEDDAGPDAGKAPAEQPAPARRRLFAPRTPTTPPAPAPAAPAPAARPARRLLPGPAAGWSNPLLLLAAAALVAGAVLGNWFALLLGWLIAYGSRRLTPAETRLAVLGVPGLSLAAGLLWLWGRTTGRWGAPIAQDHLNTAVAETWPWVVRGAAVASALFLLWRSQRTR